MNGIDLSFAAGVPALSPAMIGFLTFVLVTTSMAGLLLAVFLPQISGQNQARRRRAMVLGMTGDAAVAAGGKAAGDHRVARRSIEETLRNLEKRNRQQNGGSAGPTISVRLRQAGLRWTPLAYRIGSAVLGVVMAFVLWVAFGLGPPASVAIGLASGLWLPIAYVNYMRMRRQRAFIDAFPDAVDIIVRGGRSGIPIGDCLRIVAAETAEPVRSEFRLTVEDLTMGLGVDEAAQRMSDRVIIEEARFFSIVITIQTRTGGNLSEALANLSVVLRDRAKMRRKIKAMSSEAKASAWIIGSLPPIVCILVYLTSPQYVGLLFTTTAGNLVLAASGIWMMCGTLIMRSMINFDF